MGGWGMPQRIPPGIMLPGDLPRRAPLPANPRCVWKGVSFNIFVISIKHPFAYLEPMRARPPPCVHA